MSRSDLGERIGRERADAGRTAVRNLAGAIVAVAVIALIVFFGGKYLPVPAFGFTIPEQVIWIPVVLVGFRAVVAIVTALTSMVTWWRARIAGGRMTYFTGTSELDGRIRYAEFDAASDAAGHVVHALLVGAVTGLVALFGRKLVHAALSGTKITLPELIFWWPVGLGAVVTVGYLVVATGEFAEWRRARTIRLKVARNPELAALLVPPKQGHGDVRKYRTRQASWSLAYLTGAVIMVLIIIGAYTGIVNTQDPDGTSRALTSGERPVFAGFFGVFALLFLIPAARRARRWHTAVTVEKLSNRQEYAAQVYRLDGDGPAVPALAIPPLDVEFTDPPLRAPTEQPVTSQRNTIGEVPPRIVYLRLFDARARVRAFVKGGWRELGYVHLLRSAASVSPAELRQARRAGGLASLFVNSPRRLREELDRQPVQPLPAGVHRLDKIADKPVRVRDSYGSYPVRALLCHVAFWQLGVDMLLTSAELVVLDLSGYRPRHLGTRFEIQRVIDRFPIGKAILLIDEHTDRPFIEAQVRYHWAQMAQGSPNTGLAPRTVLIANTIDDRGAARWLAARVAV